MSSFGNVNRHQQSQKKRQQNFQMKRLLRQREVFERQRVLFSALFLIAIYAVLFFVTPKIMRISTQIESVELPENKIEVDIPSSGIYYFNVNLAEVPQANNIVQVETFIHKDGKKLYHFLAEYFDYDNKKKTYSYKFREAGKYTIEFKTSQYATLDYKFLRQEKISGFEIEKRIGGSLYYKFYFIILLIAFILIILLQDYFGPRENYKRIWEEKTYIVKDKRLRLFSFALLIIYGLCIAISITGYGYAGFSDDMHAPVEGLQGDTVYYIN